MAEEVKEKKQTGMCVAALTLGIYFGTYVFQQEF